MSLHRDVDVIIVGGGNAGLAASIAALESGLRVCLIEKTDELGGQLHISGGQFSGAGTSRQLRLGISDHPEKHFYDVMRLGHGRGNPTLIRQAVYAAPAAVNWLDETGFPFAPECPVVAQGHEAYLTPRVYWGGESGRGGLVLMEHLLKLLDQVSDNLELRTRTELTGLLIDSSGERRRVTGVEVRDAEGNEHTITSPWTVLATGGYLANRELVRALHPDHPNILCVSLPHATGDGLQILTELEIPNGYSENFLPTVGYMEDSEHPGFALRPTELSVKLANGGREPHEILVNSAGRRFVREDSRSPFELESALKAQPDQTAFVIFDSSPTSRASSVFGDLWSFESVAAMAGKGSAIVRGDTLQELAAELGLPSAQLAETVADYNSSLNEPDQFGRRSRPAAIDAGPFYAVRVVGAGLYSRGGPAIDAELRPVDSNGVSLDGCLIVGELLGMGQVSGDSFAGGMSVGSALGLGRLVGMKVAASIATAELESAPTSDRAI